MWIARRLRAFADDGGSLPTGFARFVAQVDESPYPDQTRQKEAVSIAPAEWERFLAVITGDPSLEAATLHVMADTSLRVGDVLRTQRKDLTRMIDSRWHIALEVKGGKKRTLYYEAAPEAWMHLHTAWLERAPRAKTLAEALSPKSSDPYTAAYQRVTKALKLFAEAANVSGRIFTHRLRRTVLVEALTETQDIQLVQQLAGHESPAMTMKYTDEARPQKVVDLLQRIRAKREKGPKK